MPDTPTSNDASGLRQMRLLVRAADRSQERLRADEAVPWLVERWGIEGDALAFFAQHHTRLIRYPSPADAFAAGFFCALEIADDPDLGRPTLTVA